MMKLSNQKGFSSVEIFFLLLFIGTMATVGIVALKGNVKKGKIFDTKKGINSLVAAVIGYAAQNKALPPDLSYVDNSTDAYNKSYVYAYDATVLTNVCGAGSTSIQISSAITNVAFIITSGGANHTVNSTPNTTGSYSGTVTISGDDIYGYATLEQLRTRAGCVASKLYIMNNELPKACVDGSYTANVYAGGGQPATVSPYYTWSHSATPAASWLDNTSVSNYYTLTGTAPSTVGTYSVSFTVTDGLNTYSRSLPLKVILCTGGTETTSDISFSDHLNYFATVEGNKNVVKSTTEGNTKLVLGGSGGGADDYGYGCTWFPDETNVVSPCTAISCPLDNRTTRAYFEFKTANNDTNSQSTKYAGGFTFTLMQGGNAATVCGGADSALGYGSYGTRAGISGDSAATEFDIYYDSLRNDPAYYNHAALVFEGDNVHGNTNGSITNPSCSSSVAEEGCYINTGSVTWMEDQEKRYARVELHTRCNSTCSSCNSSGSYALYKLWVEDSKPANLDNLTANYTGTSVKARHCFLFPDNLKNAKLGFTTGVPDTGKSNKFTISDFIIKFDAN
ncbi:MAG: hypothetical protein H7844_04690 [Nitrospirae bacterium YQR-1]